MIFIMIYLLGLIATIIFSIYRTVKQRNASNLIGVLGSLVWPVYLFFVFQEWLYLYYAGHQR